MLDTVLICAATIILVILLGYFTKTNIGLLAIAAAYLLGVFVLGIKPSDIVKLWPIKIFLMLFSVTFFYGYAALNGTLEKLSLKVVYASRQIPWLISVVLFFIAIALSGIGAGDGATVMLIPIAISIAKISGMNYFLAAAAVMTGMCIGGFSPISAIGIFIRELADQVGAYGPDAVNAFGNRAMFQSFVMFSVVFILSYFIFKGYAVKAPVLEKPGPYNGKQIKTLIVIVFFVGVLLLAPLLKTMFPTAPFFAKLHANIYLTFIAFISSIIAKLLKLGDEKRVFERVPWHALTTICGMGMLIASCGEVRGYRDDVRLPFKRQYAGGAGTDFTGRIFRNHEPVCQRICRCPHFLRTCTGTCHGIGIGSRHFIFRSCRGCWLSPGYRHFPGWVRLLWPV